MSHPRIVIDTVTIAINKGVSIRRLYLRTRFFNRAGGAEVTLLLPSFEGFAAKQIQRALKFYA
jgi:hypothetical protein